MGKTTSGRTPFMLTYNSKVVLPIEVALHTYQLTTFHESLKSLSLWEALDFLPSLRSEAYLREALYKLHVALLHDQSVKEQPMNTGDLVLCRTEVVARSNKHSKLTANWEGPYTITGQVRLRTYRLPTIHGQHIPWRWHSSNLCKYHT